MCCVCVSVVLASEGHRVYLLQYFKTFQLFSAITFSLIFVFVVVVVIVVFIFVIEEVSREAYN